MLDLGLLAAVVLGWAHIGPDDDVKWAQVSLMFGIGPELGLGLRPNKR